MSTGRRPKPTAIRRIEGNRGKRAWNHDEPVPPDARPRCPDHLSPVARKEWRRLADGLYRMGVLTVIDRTALAAYCASYARWVEAEEHLRETPTLFKTPGGHVQQSPWLGIANKQLELMGRYMVELGLTPAVRSRVVGIAPAGPAAEPRQVTVTFVEPAIEQLRRSSRRWRGPWRAGKDDHPQAPAVLPAAPQCGRGCRVAARRPGAAAGRDAHQLRPCGARRLLPGLGALGFEAEERLRESSMLHKTPSGYVQQSPLLGIVNKQLELMGRYMIELGLTPAARSRVSAGIAAPGLMITLSPEDMAMA